MNAITAVVTILAALLFIAAAMVKLTSQPMSLEVRDRLGIRPQRWRQIGTLELLGSLGALIGLAVPPLGIAATAGLTGVAIGALVSHFRVNDPFKEAAFAYVALVLAGAAFVLQIMN